MRSVRSLIGLPSIVAAIGTLAVLVDVEDARPAIAAPDDEIQATALRAKGRTNGVHAPIGTLPGNAVGVVTEESHSEPPIVAEAHGLIVFVAICAENTPVQECNSDTALDWLVAPRRKSHIGACFMHGQKYAAQSNRVLEGSYAKIFCRAGGNVPPRWAVDR